MQSIVEKLPDEPIILVRLRPFEDAEAEVSATAAAVDALINGTDGPVIRINDFTGLDADFCELVLALVRETKGTPGTLSDPRIKPVFVGESDPVALCAESARLPEYGKLDIPLFATLDEALAYARNGASKS
jgi:hypothetical protein